MNTVSVQLGGLGLLDCEEQSSEHKPTAERLEQESRLCSETESLASPAYICATFLSFSAV